MLAALRLLLLLRLCCCCCCCAAEPPVQAVEWAVEAGVALHNVSSSLWGVFIEEINHSAQGGLYSQQVRNSNFESASADYAPWQPLASLNASYTLQLSVRRPLNAFNPTALQVTTAGAAAGQLLGVCNPGYWGIDLSRRSAFDVSLFAFSASVRSLTVALTSADGRTVLSQAELSGLTGGWQRFATVLNVSSSVTDARFVLSWRATSASARDRVTVDVVSVMPRTDGWLGLPYIRPSLGSLIAELRPSLVRFPGGCFVEGARLADRFNWKRALGPQETRASVWDLWGYEAENGMGPFEYFSFLERLQDAYGRPAQAVWVVNSGTAHDDSIPPQRIAGWVQDALDSVEFIRGSADSDWGSRRAAMGHAAPFSLQYLAIGNEDCGKPYYRDNYRAFYAALSAAHPDLTLISNCGPDELQAAVQLFDYHLYTSPDDLIARQHEFDLFPRTAPVYVSEFAVGLHQGRGTAIGALSEAVYMLGLERNADVVQAAAYAPLMRNAEDGTPTGSAVNLINFDHWREYVSPSYWVQLMFARAVEQLQPGSVRTLAYRLVSDSNVSASACLGSLQAQHRSEHGDASAAFVLKLVSYDVRPLCLTLRLLGLPAGARLQPAADWALLAAASPSDMNSFEQPDRVRPERSSVNVTLNATAALCVPPYSLSVLRVYANV